MTTIYDFEVKKIDGQVQSLKDYQGQVLLIVNTASQCGFTNQYEGLQKLYQKYQAKGFEILAFPCNQFGQQEPGDNQTIAQFCETKFHVTFKLFDKIEVNGPDASPLYAFLKKQAPGLLGSEAIKWNFTKFLVDQSGQVMHRYAPKTTPAEIEKDIQSLLVNQPIEI